MLRSPKPSSGPGRAAFRHTDVRLLVLLGATCFASFCNDWKQLALTRSSPVGDALAHGRANRGRRLPTALRKGIIPKLAAVPHWWLGSSGSEDSIESKLRKAFEAHMSCDHVTMLRNFSIYAASLPVRESRNSPVLKLYELPFFCTEQDLSHSALRLATFPPDSRATVAYVASPSQSGKSACVLPIFLRCVEMGGPFTHYLYMPFAKNNGNWNNDENDDVALEEMGAAYMLACFKAQAAGEYIKRWLWRPAPAMKDTCQELEQQVRSFLQLPKAATGRKLLIHVDEHHRMKSQSSFRRGALSAMASLRDIVTVIATYIDLPSLPAAPRGSSQTCRFPLAKLVLDVAALMQRRAELQLPKPVNSVERRAVASVRVWLALALGKLGLSGLHTRGPLTGFLEQLQKAKTARLMDTAIAWARLCSEVVCTATLEPIEGLVSLLCGIKED